MTVELGRIGIWSLEMRFGDHAQSIEAAAELDELGFGALWVPGGVGGNVLGDLERLLAASKRMAIATGILNIWKHDAREVAAWWHGLEPELQKRVLLGLGVSHPHAIGDVWQKPLGKMRDYLAKLSDAGLPSNALCLAALGPKMLELAKERTAGVHPFLVTPEHTASARAAIGPGKLLAPEQGVVLEADPSRARELARKALSQYQTYPNYMNSWRRLGFSEEDIRDGSDRLVDALFAWGPMDRIVERVNDHFSAGADHVCLQVITGAGLDISAAREGWRRISEALL